MKLKTEQVVIGLTDPKSPTNVGAVMRAAGCYQADEVRYTGVRYARAAKFHTDTKDALKNIPLNAVDSLIHDIPSDLRIVCVDLVEGAIPLPEFEHPEKALYIFGPEDGTIAQEVINVADAVVYVPTIGCMNLAASVNVLLYDRLAKSKHLVANDDLIKRSRDTNNTVFVKT
ncbi:MULTISPECIES: RNA methyltransferase [unclassified Colwellia]|jgi:tRNA(Leu) C34 or U34 (ribose-2'-O)-methylase TrmL|uniref:RNA methyltransferase n=1 Tax=unclassified Colwellia TaxID=196834 RepID=UPI000D34E73A|nr:MULTISPECIES: RNA methyltransferase [unclassified Colwellia]AWB58356.1 23S rRNA methyltransferase [Colwellia sp. Arc7-D]MBA6417168.1 RNA methyltransferase [Colwellia sp. 6M3]|tara:strand:+ start:437 stop:952 length:516 start_codon:yes stop_codon:yes gene_type:complete